jgi:hypothetical protein
MKYADRPHLLVAIHAYATGPTRGAARAAAADITSGYSLLSAHWRPHRLHRAARDAARRRVSETRMHLATTAEVAALAGLPAEPSTYGLPAAPSRRLAPTRDTFTTSEQPPAARTTTRHPITPDDERPDDEDTPTVWSTP